MLKSSKIPKAIVECGNSCGPGEQMMIETKKIEVEKEEEEEERRGASLSHAIISCCRCPPV